MGHGGKVDEGGTARRKRLDGPSGQRTGSGDDISQRSGEGGRGYGDSDGIEAQHAHTRLHRGGDVVVGDEVADVLDAQSGSQADQAEGHGLVRVVARLAGQRQQD